MPGADTLQIKEDEEADTAAVASRANAKSKVGVRPREIKT